MSGTSCLYQKVFGETSLCKEVSPKTPSRNSRSEVGSVLAFGRFISTTGDFHCWSIEMAFYPINPGQEIDGY
jgi:hypothetical protein